jgi:hypothetical protein
MLLNYWNNSCVKFIFEQLLINNYIYYLLFTMRGHAHQNAVLNPTLVNLNSVIQNGYCTTTELRHA